MTAVGERVKAMERGERAGQNKDSIAKDCYNYMSLWEKARHRDAHRSGRASCSFREMGKKEIIS